MDSAATGLDGISRPRGHATALPSNNEFPPSQAERGRPPLGSLPPVSDQRVTTLRLPSGKVIWDLFLEGFGPLKTVAAACDEIPIYGTVGLAAGLSRALTQEDDK